MRGISRVLVANRGEIAVCVIKACRALGIQTVAALSKADMDSLPAKMADKAICIGPERAGDRGDSYLNFEIARGEARTGFGDETLYMERFIANARHIARLHYRWH